MDTASQDDTFSCDILDLYAIPMLKYRPVNRWYYKARIKYNIYYTKSDINNYQYKLQMLSDMKKKRRCDDSFVEKRIRFEEQAGKTTHQNTSIICKYISLYIYIPLYYSTTSAIIHLKYITNLLQLL